MASVLPSVRISKRFAFKAGTQVWSNRYHFTGGAPSSDANWKALFDAIVNIEKTCFDGSITIVSATGYDAGSEVPVSSKTYTTTGTLSTTDAPVPGECAALVRYSTAARSTKNHPIYCFNYYHGCLRETSSGSFDALSTQQQTALGTYAAGWLSGITAGGVTARRASPAGHAATGYLVEEFMTHRDFPPSTSV